MIYWIYGNFNHGWNWYIALADEDEVYFPEIDFEEEMNIKVFKEEFPQFKVKKCLPPQSCTCDDIGDSPCPIHRRENELQDRAIKAENQLCDLYFIMNPQYGEPTETGYYVVWPNEDMKHPIGLAECRRGPNGGYRKMRWLEPEKHGEFNWNHDDWHWTRLPEGIK